MFQFMNMRLNLYRQEAVQHVQNQLLLLGIVCVGCLHYFCAPLLMPFIASRALCFSIFRSNDSTSSIASVCSTVAAFSRNLTTIASLVIGRVSAPRLICSRCDSRRPSFNSTMTSPG